MPTQPSKPQAGAAAPAARGPARPGVGRPAVLAALGATIGTGIFLAGVLTAL